MKTYVLGFLFNKNKNKLLLIRKNRPSWQAGKLNGIGGKVEEGEAVLTAMHRETKEETGYGVAPGAENIDWQRYATMIFEDEVVHCYKGFSGSYFLWDRLKKENDEDLVVVDINDIHVLGKPELTSNLPWLIAMVFSEHATPIIINLQHKNGFEGC